MELNECEACAQAVKIAVKFNLLINVDMRLVHKTNSLVVLATRSPVAV